MEYIGERVTLGENEAIQVDYDGQCKIEILDDVELVEFQSPKRIASVGYWPAYAKRHEGFPVLIDSLPPGNWNVLISDKSNLDGPNITVVKPTSDVAG